MVDVSAAAFVNETSIKDMHQHTDYLPASNNKVGYKKAFIPFNQTVNCKANYECCADKKVDGFKFFHYCIF